MLSVLEAKTLEHFVSSQTYTLEGVVTKSFQRPQNDSGMVAADLASDFFGFGIVEK